MSLNSLGSSTHVVHRHMFRHTHIHTKLNIKTSEPMKVATLRIETQTPATGFETDS